MTCSLAGDKSVFGLVIHILRFLSVLYILSPDVGVALDCSGSSDFTD